MERARLPVRPDAVVVEHAVGDVRVFLDFTQDYAGTNGVSGSGGDKYGVTRADRYALKTILRAAIGNGALERPPRDARAQAHPQFRALPRRNHVPHLGLACSSGRGFVRFGVGVVGMHLHRQFVLRENELHQQGNAGQPRQMRAGPGFGQARPDFTEGAPCKLARGEPAVIPGEPGFADGLAFNGSFGEQGRKVPRAPDSRQKNRDESRGRPPRCAWVERHEAVSAIAKNFSRRRNPSSIRSIDVA
jgi:hypothetical protein